MARITCRGDKDHRSRKFPELGRWDRNCWQARLALHYKLPGRNSHRYPDLSPALLGSLFVFASLSSVESVGAGGSLPALPVVPCNFDSSDRNSMVIQVVALADVDVNLVEMTFTASGPKISVAQETVAHSGAKERCVRELKRYYAIPGALDCSEPNTRRRQ